MKVDQLEKLGACLGAIEWARKQKNRQAAWDACERGDWMLWILGRTCKHNSAQHRAVVLAACKCARLSLQHVPKGEDRPKAAIVAAERWARNPSVHAADAADAADAAGYAAYAAGYAANAARRAEMFRQCARIVRKFFPKPPAMKKGGEG